jgi:hypothetical protein
MRPRLPCVDSRGQLFLHLITHELVPKLCLGTHHQKGGTGFHPVLTQAKTCVYISPATLAS